MKAYVAKMSCTQLLLILHCTYILKINSSFIKSVAMTLYDIVWLHNPDCENSPDLYVFSASKGSRFNKSHPALEYSAALRISAGIYSG